MHRRRFLELIALSTTTASSAGLAGCIASTRSAGDADTTTTTPADSTPGDTTEPLPCPTVRDVDRHVCLSDDIGSPALARTEREIPTDGGVTHITVENRSDGPYGLNPYAWGIHTETPSGDWERVDHDRAYIEPWVRIESDSGLVWRVATDSDDTGSNEDEFQCALDLDPGTYAWSVELHDATEDRFAVVVPFVVV